MSWRARVYDLVSGRFLVELTVRAENLRSAEAAAISKTCFALRGDPRQMTVRQLHARGGRDHE